VSPLRIVGIVEGFYGTPWSWQARTEVLRAWGAAGGTHYLYAPKDDPFHRTRWREPYPEAFVADFGRLCRAASEEGVAVGAAVSPGLDVRYASTADFDELRAKLAQFAAAGASHVSLAFDDIPLRFPDASDAGSYGPGPEGLAEAHADWANRIAAEDFGSLLLGPTEYIGTRPTPYLEHLGAALDPRIDVAWTGTTVVSPRIRAEEAAARAATLRRRPVVWDNHPVNDVMMRTSLHMGPLEGREQDLDRHVDGFYWNPMNQAHASLVPLLTAAAYARDPAGYEPEAAWAQAVAAVGGRAAESLAVLADASRVGPVTTRVCPQFAKLCDAAVASLGDGCWQAPWDALASHAAVAAGAGAALRGTSVGEEVQPWTEQLTALSNVVQAARYLVETLHADEVDFMAAAMAFGALSMVWQRSFERTEQVWGQRLGLYAGLVQGDGGAAYGIDAASSLVWDGCLVDRLVRDVVAFAGDRMGTFGEPHDK